MQLIGKIIIKGKLITITGLHIGGSKTSLTIGGIDNNVIKTAKGIPYIPGSSLKGKLRSLLARKEGSLFFSQKEKTDIIKTVEKEKNQEKDDIKKQYLEKFLTRASLSQPDESYEYIMDLFGYSGDSDEKQRVGHTRLLVRDALLHEDAYMEEFFSKDRKDQYEYTEGKWENVINRRTGTAEHPRQMERVPAGAQFNFEVVYNLYDDVKDDAAKLEEHLKHIVLSLLLLQDDYIGGQGSRGYGQVKVRVESNKTYLKLIDPNTYEYLQKVDWKTGKEDCDQVLDQFVNDLQNFTA